MKKKIILAVLVIGLIAAGFLVFRPEGQKSPLPSPLQEVKKSLPSETFIDYTDPAGFNFSYPDNLSIIKNDTDASTYADMQLSSNDVNGSLNLKITDSKFATLNDWLKLYKSEPVEKKLGNLKALEVKTADRLYLGALDQGILFTIEMPLIEEAFWMKVYDKVLTSFSFASPEGTTSQGNINASSDVTFEGEEVVE